MSVQSRYNVTHIIDIIEENWNLIWNLITTF